MGTELDCLTDGLRRSRLTVRRLKEGHANMEKKVLVLRRHLRNAERVIQLAARWDTPEEEVCAEARNYMSAASPTRYGRE